MIIEEIVDELETLGKKKTDRTVWETTLYYYGAIMLNIMAIRKDTEISSNDHIIFYAIILAGSGVGKTFSAKQLEKLWNFQGYPERYIKYLDKYYDQSPESGGLEEKAEDIRYMPKDMILNLEGTQEGLFFTAKAQLNSNFGSINIFTDEFGDVISGAKDIINKLKQMYDGEMLPKMIKGTETTENYSILRGIVCNFLGMGTSKGFSEEASKDLIKSVQSGLFRRTYIVDSGGSYEEIIENKQPNNVEKSAKHLEGVLLKHTKLSSKNITYRIEPRIFPHSEDFVERLAEFSSEIIVRYNNDRTNERKSLDTGAELMVVDLAYIIAFIEGDDMVNKSHLEKAIDYFYRTRESAEYTFSPKHPHKAMFNLLSQRNGLTITEMSELDYTIPIKSNAVQDAVAGLRELCYIHNQHLKVAIGAVVRYSIEHLPMNKLDKIILSVSQDNKMEKCIDYKATTLSWKDIPRLVVSENFDSFTCCHYEHTKQAPHGHRQASSFIEEQNLIAFDIDEGMSI
ncbi:MAG: hypothetical protein KAH01_05395, partial [Caldisericia bacterium]|nr:hypothetical protein [Caldisericia bacterium]